MVRCAAVWLVCGAAACGGAPLANPDGEASELPLVALHVRLVNRLPAGYRWQRMRMALDYGPLDAVDFGRRLAENDALELWNGVLYAGDHSLSVAVELGGTGEWGAYSGLAVKLAAERFVLRGRHDFELVPRRPYALEVIAVEAQASGPGAHDAEPALRFVTDDER